MKRWKTALATAAVMTGAAVGTVGFGALPAFAASCSASPTTASFSKDANNAWHIKGSTTQTCSLIPYTSIGRVKEDRPLGQPDAVHQTVTHNNVGNSSDTVSLNATTCQDGDAIYIEGQASSPKVVEQSTRKTMNC